MSLTKIKASNITSTGVTSGSYTNANITVNSGGQITSASSGTGGGASTDVPKISNLQVTNSTWTVLDDTAVDVLGGYILLTGVNFVSGCLVYIGQTPATSVAFVSSTTVRVIVPAITAGTYPVYLVNPDGGVAIRVPGVTLSASPAWQTASSLADQYDATAINLQLLATDAATYSIASGSLPPGLTMNSSGLISGTVTGVAVDTTYTFSVVATDPQLQDSPRTFTLTITVSDPYFRLTTLLLTGNSGANIVTDASTNNFPITVAGDSRASNFSPYLTGWSCYFDGTGDFLDIPTNAAFDFGIGDFTIECWAYLTTLSNSASGLITCMNVAGTNPSWLLGFSNTANQMAFLSSYFNAPVGFSYVNYYNKWTHIAVTRSGTALRLFADGVLVANSTDSTTISTGGKSIRIGSRYQNDSQYLINGYVSNLRIVKGTALYTANFTPATTTLTAVANTSLLTCHANRLVDSSTNNFDITKNGDVSVVSFNPFNLTNTGTSGSMYFDGTGDYLTWAGTTIGANPFCFETWVYFTGGFASIQALLGIWVNGATGDLSIRVNSATQICFDRSGVSATNFTIPTLTNNQWYHIVACRDAANNSTIFVNGIRSSTGVVADSYAYPKTTSIAGLYSGVPYHVTGYMSNVRLIVGSTPYDPTQTTLTVPTAPLAAVTNTKLLTLQNRQPHNNHSFQDSSTNNHLITRSGNTTQGTFSPFSQTGWGNYFSGSSQYLSISSPPTNLREWWTTDFTIEAWIFPLNATNLQNVNAAPTMCGNCDTAGYDYWSFGPINSGIVRFKYYNGSTVTVDSTQTVTINQWNHVAMTKTSSGITIFVNGVASSTTAVSGTPQAPVTVPFTIGANYTTSINAHISNLRAVKGRAVYTSNYTPPTSPLTRTTGGQNPPQGTECSLLTCQSNRFLDSNGINNPASSPLTITTSGSPSIQAFSPYAPTATYSAVTHGGSAYFDGSGDILTLPSLAHNGLKNNNFTWECWVYRNSVTDTTYADAICCQLSNFGTNAGFAVGINPGGQVGYAIGSGAGWTIRLGVDPGYPMGSIIVPLRAWTHIALVRNGSTFVGFVNGAVDQSFTSSSSIDEITSTYAIGRWHDTYTRYWNGYITNMRIVLGEALYSTSNTTNGTQVFTPPTAPFESTTRTKFLLNFTNDAIEDATGRNIIETAGDARTTSVVAKWGGSSMAFDGSGDYLISSNTNMYTLYGAFTIEGWVYRNTSSSRLIFIEARTAGGWANYLFGILTNGTAEFVTSNSANYYNPSETVTSGQWVHVALVRDTSNVVKLYINGNGAATTKTISGVLTPAASSVWIGGQRDPQYSDGYINDLRITQLARYTSNFTPPTASLRLK